MTVLVSEAMMSKTVSQWMGYCVQGCSGPSDIERLEINLDRLELVVFECEDESYQDT